MLWNVILYACFIAIVTATLQYPTFNWDPRNKIFHRELCDGEFAHITVNYGSQIHFVCPHEALNSDIFKGDLPNPKLMYENMYLVTEEEFNSCEIGKTAGSERRKLVMQCDKPEDNTKMKYENFYIFNVKSPFSYSFQPNTTYYFIATSTGDKGSLGNLKGGRCKNDNMKLAIYIRPASEKSIDNEHLCFKPKVNHLIPTTKATTTSIKKTSPTNTNTYKPNKPQAAAKTKTNNNQTTASFNSTSIVCLIAGLIAGFILCLLLIAVKKKFLLKSSSSDVESTSGFSEQHENHGTLTTYIDTNDPNQTLTKKHLNNKHYFD